MDSEIIKIEGKVGRDILIFETGLIAKQANGSCIVRVGDNIVLSTCVAAKKPRTEPPEFVPLTVEYKERTYAAGKIPGGFFKREGKPREKEILAGRLTDRAIRPLFPDYYNTETQVVSMVLSSDGDKDCDVLSINAASACLMISDIPFNGPVGAVRIAKIEKDYIINPTFEERKNAILELVVAGTRENILMVEGGANQVSHSELIEAMELAKGEIIKICDMQVELVKKKNKKKFKIEPPLIKEEIKKEVDLIEQQLKSFLESYPTKKMINEKISTTTDKLVEKFTKIFPDDTTINYQVKTLIDEVIYKISRNIVLKRKTRIDGRKFDEIRKISIKVGYLPRAHGSALFTRGETQTIATTTLGTQEDQQILDELEGKTLDRFMLHYNFPGFSTGDIKPDKGPSRREIGHGNLAKRALFPLIPSEDEFPYTIRVVSDILESNGSSSMATVCGGSLSLFDAGVPMKAACAGIAMGLITGENNEYVVLSDIAGLEDHFGDMDFKLAGTRKGITAFQMDVKLSTGIPLDILAKAMEQAIIGIHNILDIMDKEIQTPRQSVSEYAPKICRIPIAKDKIGLVIGTGGKTIKGIIEESGANIEINENGYIFISSPNQKSIDKAKTMIQSLTENIEVGKIYKGKVIEIRDFGAFVEILPGKIGLLHISEIDNKRIKKVEDVIKIGDVLDVKVIDTDEMGRPKLSRKAIT
ncbi:MAG: polyribonucleotide nucleotidyltransferase [Elusimicrobiales bacterium]|nr:polyribonucleotide nucleotidyltransferase [Elusimicrobiales bacterium]